MVIKPLAKGGSFVIKSPRLKGARLRAIATSVLCAALVVWLLFFLPFPLRTRAEGVLWLPEESIVRAGTEGTLERIQTRSGEYVRGGTVLFICTDPVIAKELRVLEGRKRELEARYTQLIVKDRKNAEITKEELEFVNDQLRDKRERAEALTIRSGGEGVLITPFENDLPGKFVKRGEILAYIVDLNKIQIHAVLSQRDIDLVRGRTEKVDIRLAERIEKVHRARIKRIIPNATNQLPSPALGIEGGGRIALDPSEPRRDKSVQKIFQVDLEMPPDVRVENLGGRVYGLFDHRTEPVAFQLYRSLRQLFLARFNV